MKTITYFERDKSRIASAEAEKLRDLLSRYSICKKQNKVFCKKFSQSLMTR